jgi:hypothetical protein
MTGHIKTMDTARILKIGFDSERGCSARHLKASRSEQKGWQEIGKEGFGENRKDWRCFIHKMEMLL